MASTINLERAQSQSLVATVEAAGQTSVDVDVLDHFSFGAQFAPSNSDCECQTEECECNDEEIQVGSALPECFSFGAQVVPSTSDYEGQTDVCESIEEGIQASTLTANVYTQMDRSETSTAVQAVPLLATTEIQTEVSGDLNKREGEGSGKEELKDKRPALEQLIKLFEKEKKAGQESKTDTDELQEGTSRNMRKFHERTASSSSSLSSKSESGKAKRKD
ncbi:hypothetical protein PENTCL1PPCAC_1276 [Pristionchus entomophagus]|uniref:Uncharacterized protein n=1 Tax=Pristionchus entomophagus TaxID=358040 RepID=A0AAV5SHI8_9BILA|nr:hypothetical protein PENTCL1PPCAC_1276 [Pristionchus entomophagus]